ncbi:GNAT family N-acetyltransferase [Clostridium sp. MSJ-11]|uniref:GNAT family N-acetyltransferase n=1 Tax=Clostridium mobile TaxID=2841512 RepID=A0ABS6EMM8_9CLOT|nr:GNAT family N-acetyltransferase [Clostridium mobile]
MMNYENVNIELVNGSNSEYLIKDEIGINLGRIYIVELSRDNSYCCFRVKFYKNEEKSYGYLKSALNKLITLLFNRMGIYKVNALVDEDTKIYPFTALGFELEGVVTSSIGKGNLRKDELLFGIDKHEFNNHVIRKTSLEGRRIKLKILTPENAEQLLEYYINNKEHLEPFEQIREKDFYTLSFQRKTLVDNYKQFLNGTAVNFGIYISDKFIGKIQLSNIIMGVFKSSFVGYSIDKEEQRKGYMKEALMLLVDYAFNELNLHRLEASTLVDNIKSQRVLKSCGFSEIGINKSYLYINGGWKDHITFSKIRDS